MPIGVPQDAAPLGGTDGSVDAANLTGLIYGQGKEQIAP